MLERSRSQNAVFFTQELQDAATSSPAFDRDLAVRTDAHGGLAHEAAHAGVASETRNLARIGHLRPKLPWCL
jgi:hypothetical protein